MDLTSDELAMLASVYYYPIYESERPVRPSKYRAVVKSLVERGLVFEILEGRDPGERSTWDPAAGDCWVVRAAEKGKQFFESLSTFDRAIASRNAGLFHAMGKLIELLPMDRLPFFLSAEVPFVQECASKRLAELTGNFRDAG